MLFLYLLIVFCGFHTTVAVLDVLHCLLQHVETNGLVSEQGIMMQCSLISGV